MACEYRAEAADIQNTNISNIQNQNQPKQRKSENKIYVLFFSPYHWQTPRDGPLQTEQTETK